MAARRAGETIRHRPLALTAAGVNIVVFGPEERVGARVGEQIVDLNAADASLPASLDAFIAAGERAIESAQRAVASISSLTTGAVVRLSDVQLRAPWARRRIACVGGNYAAHSLGNLINRGVTDMTAEKVAMQIREAGQWGCWKVPSEVAGPDDEIPFPNRVTYFDYEGELAIVIGKRGKRIKAAQVADFVFGVTLLNDWSSRDPSSTGSRPVSYNLEKNFDFSTSMGPGIIVGELDPLDVEVETRVNGSLRQRYNTKEMIYSFGEVLEFLSEDITFVPGDMISAGTSAGTAHDSTRPRPEGGPRPLDLFLKRGDVVELSSPKIGTLRNRIA